MFERIFHTYFWVFTCFFLLSASYLCANIASSTIQYYLPPPPPQVQVATGSFSDATFKKRAKYAILNKSNLFDPNQKLIVAQKAPPKPRPRKEAPKTKPKHCDPDGSYKPTKLPLQLKGTVLASDPDYSLAAIWDNKRRKLFVMRVGENFFGIQICRIERDCNKNEDGEDECKSFVKLDRGGGILEYLELGKPPGRGGSYAMRRNMYRKYRKLRNTKLNLKKIKKLGGNRFTIKRDFLDNLTRRLDIVASQAAIVPYFEKGRAAGFRIYHIRNNSLYKKLGLKNGDVIKRINGYEFTSPQKALEAYSNLMSANNLSVEVKRGGKMVNFGYKIKQ